MKATMQLPHGGGQRLTPGSTDYQTILDWVRNGAPLGEEGEKESIHIARVEVYPTQTVLDAQGKQQLLVTAHLSNGQREDITDEVLYASNDAEVVRVNSSGEVEAVGPGETVIMIRATGTAVSALVGVISEPIPNYPEVEPKNFIDKFVFAKLRQFNIIPSELSSDAEFLRRVCLDLTGTLPPPERTREFLASKDPQKREKQLIETLLNTPEYEDYWTYRFADLFRIAWFQIGMGLDWCEDYWEWIRENIKENRPYNQVARERIAALGYSAAPSRHFLPNGEVRYPQNKMAEETSVFLGRRMDCAQCNNHPFEAWRQDQFWGLAAFFGRTNLINGRGDPYFAEATVNGFWGYFFGRAFVEPVDDFRLTNPPTNQALLDALAKHFVDHGYSFQHAVPLILNSRVYQLSGATNKTNAADR